MQTKELSAPVSTLARKAGAAVMDIYQTDFAIYDKSDNSPLTEADMAAHRVLTEGLQALTPNIPALSEESSDAIKKERLNWQTFWLIDPLDGTKEFIKKNGEFTINVALIENGEPVFGVVYAPAIDTLYWGAKGIGAYKESKQGDSQAIAVAATPKNNTGWQVVGSRSHQSEAFKTFMKRLPEAEIVAMGSSLKLCLVAEGHADLYPRLSPTCEWDTAAAHAIVMAAGGLVLNLETLKPLTYNQNPNSLLNPHFIVCPAISPYWA
ncbi:MAG: 3'(2'),5'-bisphosphate nucleotidase [Neptuniibacter caesariensis]|uniref:3'(2'),5'-bisphosphate nucleotidase CysQ n=1 Tax=Neptuniibacter caesariensis TaxID=207954 RepID=A0A2G6JJK2_NEPCE|nr:MAG: 3'(2'),5'-bisphosphate nucleotidase [Neptuniibacter caesariensis]